MKKLIAFAVTAALAATASFARPDDCPTGDCPPFGPLGTNVSHLSR